MANKKFNNPKDQQIHDALTTAFNAMKEKGYEPYTQLAGYIFSEDEIYITFHNNARTLITDLDREEMLKHILRNYFEG